MASSSARPHRQARSGVSYRDPYFDYEDDLSFCRRTRSSPSPAIAATTSKKSKDSQPASKKNLALKHAKGLLRYYSMNGTVSLKVYFLARQLLESRLLSFSARKNRANAKERAEAGQLQRAINESLSQRSSEAKVHLQRGVHESLPDRSADVGTSVFNHEKSAVDCMDGHAFKTIINDKRISMDCVDETACNDCVAFQCLLDVATEAVLESNIHVGEAQDIREGPFREQTEEDGQGLELSVGKNYNGEMIEPSVRMLHDGEMINESTFDETNDELGKCKDYLHDKTKDQINVCDERDSDPSNDWEEGSNEQVDTEDESSGLSDESGCERRRPVKVQQKARKAAVKDNVFPVQVKKARSARPLLKLEALSAENCPTSVSTPCKSSLKASGGKENILTSSSKESTKNTALNLKQQIAAANEAFKKSNQSVENFQFWEAKKAQVFDSVSAGQQGILSLPLQSPILLHRRVIGLSRRYRPPPLHPYLPKRDR